MVPASDGCFCTFRAIRAALSLVFGRYVLMPSASEHQEEVAEGEEHKELVAVLGLAAVTGLHVTELRLDDTEGMLDLWP